MNKNDFEESGVHPRRVVTWHLVSAIALTVGCALSIYPMKSTIYLIMIYQGFLKGASQRSGGMGGSEERSEDQYEERAGEQLPVAIGEES